MDNKSDDSAGSDSLDKTLQKKCVVDDCGQGEGAAAAECAEAGEKPHTADAEASAAGRLENAKPSEKTSQAVGDAGAKDTVYPAGPPTAAVEQQTAAQHIAASTSKAPPETAATPTSNAFETKVKQISKNLKETTLAESGNKSLEESASSSSSSSSSTSSSSSEGEVASTSGSTHTTSNQAAEMDASMTSLNNESMDELDHRSKKVRFHPDVKENDGGKRIRSKRKKKMKGYSSGRSDDEMELDEADYCEEDEDEFNLAKTIAEAQDYLKLYPLTFEHQCDSITGILPGGTLELDLSDSEENNIHLKMPTDTSAERILGKQTKGGKIEFLLRYADRPGLHWETEEYIHKQYPYLLNKYEENRESRQERLMLYLSVRQKARQRYTDF